MIKFSHFHIQNFTISYKNKKKRNTKTLILHVVYFFKILVRKEVTKISKVGSFIKSYFNIIIKNINNIILNRLIKLNQHYGSKKFC
jgi:hypothetical protein